VTIRAVIVDDEELARRGLRARLDPAEFSIVAECADGAEALAAIATWSPDLVFLDIQMPEMSGLEVAAAIDAQPRPHVIFVTAYDDYAVQAFEVHALDYVVKPIDDRRLAAVLARARTAIQQSRDGDFGRRVTQAIAGMRFHVATPDALMADRILVRTGGRIVVVRVADVDWVEASGDYASLHVGKKAWLVREAMGVIAEQYAPHGIARIHRSTLVNLDRVAELRPLSNGEFIVVLRDGTELKMSRNYRQALGLLGGTGL
jgi:two-component system, LytTR family, response regulator